MRHFALVLSGLRATAENGGLPFEQLVIMIPEPACLRGAAASAGNQIPALGERCSGYSGHGVTINDSARRAQAAEVHSSARRGSQFDGWHFQAGEVTRGAIVVGNGQVGREWEVLISGHQNPINLKPR